MAGRILSTGIAIYLPKPKQCAINFIPREHCGQLNRVTDLFGFISVETGSTECGRFDKVEILSPTHLIDTAVVKVAVPVFRAQHTTMQNIERCVPRFPIPNGAVV